MPQNLIEKIAQRYAVGLDEGQVVQSGDFISIRPAHIMTHDNTGAVIKKFKSIGASKIADNRQPVFTLDHNVQDQSEENLKKYAMIEAFASVMEVDFYPALRGIGHQIMCEEGYVWPGTMVVASDSHSNMYGGLGCLGTPVVRTDAATIWATGRTWWQVPPVAKVTLTGELRVCSTGKDVIITLCGLFNNDEVLNHAIEFTGDGVDQLTISERLTIANMTTEWGALAGVFPTDDRVIAYLKKQCAAASNRGPAGVPSDTADGNARCTPSRFKELEKKGIKADRGAYYAREITLDLSTVSPHVAGPENVKIMTSAVEMAKKNIKIQKAYLVSCVNSRVDDLADAARVVRGHKVARGVEFYIAAASEIVMIESQARGDWQDLLDAGAIPLPPGCGPCIGLGAGLLEDGEVGISATNRNFKGRMGAPSAKAYLASPAVVAASALAGKIAEPPGCNSAKVKGDFKINPKMEANGTTVKILPGFADKFEGEIVFCHQDNLNTDGIYPGKYTYIDDFTSSQQASVVMENYDPDFGEIVRIGDILVGGQNFGTGSSREQAATALKYRGIQMVIASSFSETYKRNAFNNGFLVLEAPELVEDLKQRFGTEKLSVRTGLVIRGDFSKATVELDGKAYSIGALGVAAQELIIAGGLEVWTKKQLVGSR